MSLVLFISFLLLPQSSLAQEIGESIMGFKVGANFIDYQKDANNSESAFGYHAGMYMSFRISRRFGLQPELLYSQQRAFDLLTTDNHATFGYFAFPLVGKIFVTKHLNVQVVPQIGHLINATMRAPGVPPFNGKTFFKGLDLSVGGGIGIESSKGLNASVRYFYGFSDTFKPVINPGDSPKNTLQVSIGYTFL